jgi:hypothetical protein
MQRFTKIKTWERSHAFALAIYKESSKFPRHEIFGITAQLRRAAVSIPCNIAEGSGDLGYFDPSRLKRFLGEADRIARMASQLRRTVESTERRSASASNSQLSALNS